MSRESAPNSVKVASEISEGGFMGIDIRIEMWLLSGILYGFNRVIVCYSGIITEIMRYTLW